MITTNVSVQATEQVATTAITTNIKRVSTSCFTQYIKSLKVYFVKRLGGAEFLKRSGTLLRQTMMSR